MPVPAPARDMIGIFRAAAMFFNPYTGPGGWVAINWCLIQALTLFIYYLYVYVLKLLP
jgi:hypothetical protein